MSIEAKSISERWARIRDNEECDLSLSPESVAWYLGRRESELVRERILESLIQFADWRLDPESKDQFSSTRLTTVENGVMATCEGLEAFLVPAVEGALPFSDFLANYEQKGRDSKAFINAFKRDISGLLDNWEKGIFPGEPYANTRRIKASILPHLSDYFKNINITESAALACRVLIHLLTLKLNRPEEKLFQTEVAVAFEDERLFGALSNAIDFLIRAFQKGEGNTEEERISNASIGLQPGSGWSWTDREGLPPMLFFTAAAVDAFAELDLYLIRTVIKKQFTIEAHKLAGFYKENEEKLQQYQNCVDMARRWVKKIVLPDLINNYGQYAEKLLQGKDTTIEELQYDKAPPGYEQYSEDLAKLEEMQHPPMVFYNSLYALLILLWSWGDWNDEGKDIDEDAKSKINRAISQLVYNYGSLPVVKEILNRFNYLFYLPGKNIFSSEKTSKEREYLDSAFLPLLTRLLVLFVVYGVGDRNMLEPVIRNLYVELLQSRYRARIEYSALWSSNEIEVFSTQRALQALTFYYAYAKGKEIVDEKSAGSGGILLRNKTGLEMPLILEARFEREVDVSQVPVLATESSPAIEPPKAADEFKDLKFAEYCKKIPGWKYAMMTQSDEADALQNRAKELGEAVLLDCTGGQIHDSGAAKLILNSLANILAKPELDDGSLRESELSLLTEQYRDLTSRSAGAGSNGQQQ